MKGGKAMASIKHSCCAWLNVLILVFVFAGCTNFSDLAFKKSFNSQENFDNFDNFDNSDNSSPVDENPSPQLSAILNSPSSDAVGQKVTVRIQTQGNPTKVVVAYNNNEYECTNVGGGIFETTFALDITKNPNEHTFTYWAQDASGTQTTPQQKTVRWAYHWGRRIGGDNASSGNDCGLATVVDSQGNVYVLGVLAKTNTGSDTNVAEDWGLTDVFDTDNASLYNYWTFITKINADGSYGWTKIIGEVSMANNVTLYSAAIDRYDNLYVVGKFSQTVNFAAGWNDNDSRTSIGTGTFVLKVHRDGSYGGTKIIPAASGYQVIPYALAFDADNNLFLTGYFWTGATTNYINFASDWGGTDQKAPNGQTDCFITCITNVPQNGWDGSSYGWTKRIGGTSTDNGKTILVREAANARYLYIAGDYLSTDINFAEDWGGNDSKGGGGSYSDMFLTKLEINKNDFSSTYQWTHVFGAANTSHWGSVVSLAQDADGNIYVAGNFTGNNFNFAADWGGDDKKSGGSQDVFVTMIYSDDSYGTTKRFGAGSTNYDYASSIVSDAQGNLYLLGYFQATCNFAADFSGTENKTARGSLDIFLTKFNMRTNAYYWTKTFGTAQNDMQNYSSAIPRLSLYAPQGYLYLVDTVNVGNNSSVTLNLGEDFYYDDSKTTKTKGEIIVVKLQP